MKIKMKLMIIVGLSILIIFFLAVNIMYDSYKKYEQSLKTESIVNISNDISLLIHNLQIERGLSLGYLFFQDDIVYEKIIKEREAVDIQLNNILRKVNIEDINEEIIIIKNDLISIRKKVDNFEIGFLELLDFYTSRHEILINKITELTKEINESYISNKILAYTNLLLYNDSIGVERAISSIIANWSYSKDLINQLIKSQNSQEIYETLFYFYANKYDKKSFKQLSENRIFKEVKILRNLIDNLSIQEKNFELSRSYFDIFTKKITLIYDWEKLYIERLNKSISELKDKLEYEFLILSSIIFVFILIFVLLVYFIYKRIINSINDFHNKVKSFFEYINHEKDDVEFLDESSNDEFAELSKIININIINTKQKIEEDKKVLSEAIEIMNEFEKGKLYKRLDIEVQNNPILNNLKNILNQMANNLEMTIEDLEHANYEYEMSLDNLKKTQNQLVEAEKMASLGGLVAGVAHEINTPVGIGITSSTHFYELVKSLKNKYENDDMSEDDFNYFLKDSEDLSRLININLQKAADLIKSFKQIAVDQTSEESRTFNLKEYLDEILLSINNITKKSNLNFEIKCDESLSIKSYPGLISQVITNLIMNSLIHAYDEHENGTISIFIGLDEKDLIIRYQDDGKGISEENLKKIYEPFFTTNRDNGGSGLGMNIIYNIITKQLNGTIKCESKLKEGTIFNIKFPIL